MNLLKSKLSAAIAIGLLSGSALAAEISCPITPAYSIITEGQTLQLTAECTGGVLASIDWKMDSTSVTGVVNLTGYAAGNPIKYTTPVGLGDANETQEFTFTVVGVPAPGHTFAPSTSAKVVVKPSSAVVALAKGVAIDPTAPTKKVDAACGTADGTTVATMPTSTAQCASGSTVTLPVSGPQYFTWSCLSLTGGAEASCYALRQGYVAPVEPTATVYGLCGSASGQTLSAKPTGGLCNSGTASVVATGAAYTWTCNGSNAAVTSDDANCSATIATVSNPPPSSSSDDPGIGSGLWVPPNTTNRVVADQSGSSTQYLTSYVPGCLNGLYITTASASGCGGSASYKGTISGTDYTFAFGSGKVLSLRYTSKSTAGTSLKYFTLASGDGGNVGQNVKVWLSTNPAATYDATSASCKSTSTTQPYVLTGPGYCPVTPNTPYYLSMSIDTACTTCRYKVEEGASDFQ